jgi:hypothetical protein
VCEDGSIFVDWNGEHFGHVLEYMRDGHVSVAEPGVRPEIGLLVALKRELGFYCIKLVAEPKQVEVAYAIGGGNRDSSSMECSDATTDQWSALASMHHQRSSNGACVMAGELYVTGGYNDGPHAMSSVEKYSPSSDTWSIMAPLPVGRACHAAIAIGLDMYVIGGAISDTRYDHGEDDNNASLLKFDSTQGTWSEMTPMPDACSNLSACAFEGGIYVFSSGFARRSSVLGYDIVDNAWSRLGPMPGIYPFELSASMMDEMVYLVCANEVHQFDPNLGVWSSLAPTLHESPSVCFVLEDCLYAAGGRVQNSSVERYDLASNTWTLVADMLEGRDEFSALTLTSTIISEENLFDSMIAKAST